MTRTGRVLALGMKLALTGFRVASLRSTLPYHEFLFDDVLGSSHVTMARPGKTASPASWQCFWTILASTWSSLAMLREHLGKTA
jgi:hypothetical protein